MLLQNQATTLRPQTTAHLAQTMSLLELSGDELRQKIESELSSNPALELVDEIKCPTCFRYLTHHGSCPVCNLARNHFFDQPIVFISPRSSINQYDSFNTDEESVDDEWTAASEDLPTYVLRQIAPELDSSERQVAAHILSSLDDDGLLSVPIIEIASYNHKPISHVEKVLKLIQRADPVGVGSPTPQQALIVQLEMLTEYQDIPAYAFEAIRNGMKLLSRRAYGELGTLLGITISQAKELANFLSDNLNPFPARSHWGDRQSFPEIPASYQNPDIIISRLSDNDDSYLMVEIISPYSGYLRVNPLYKQVLSESPQEKSEQWESDYENATLLVKCLQQRNNTIVRMMEKLVVWQREFILNGDAYLLPITRARVSEELEVHESTVSRAVASKAVQLPDRRIIPLAKFFDRSLHIRTALKDIVQQETQPLSDTQIADLLLNQGYAVARRTVAKYRAMEGILPARLRRSNGSSKN